MERPLFDRSTLVNANTLWGAFTAEVLHQSGLKYAVISPGSRSTPLTYAFAKHGEITCLPVLDERSAGFFALGLARRSHQPVVLVCTSGTAAAHYYPAVIEARESGIPLLVMTADRPPEMRHCQSGQAIDQLKLYGTYPLFQTEMSLPERSIQHLSYLRQTLINAWNRCQFPVSGPVHLNCPFRDPLPPINPESDESGFGSQLSREIIESLLEHISPSTKVAFSVSDGVGKKLLSAMKDCGERGLIIAGWHHPTDPGAYCRSVGILSRVLGWPILADALNPLRNHVDSTPGVVIHYDTVLRNPKIAARLLPDAVLSLGPLPTSKVLRQWLSDLSCPSWIMHPSPENVDGVHRRATPVHLDPVSLVEHMGDLPVTLKSGYAEEWHRLNARVTAAFEKKLNGIEFLFEGKVSAELPRILPPRTHVFIANSMPVRDAEYFWPENSKEILPVFNRGANGIDGTLSSALGHAYEGCPTVLLTGDLALLHDTNGFLLSSKLKGSLSIVLINNNGGGIFEHLPISSFDPPFEEYWVTPQRIHFGNLAKAYGIEHYRVETIEGLWKNLLPLPGQGVRLIEVVTDRKRDSRFRQELFEEVSNAL